MQSIKNDIDQLNIELQDALNECNPEEMLDLASQLKNTTNNVKLQITNKSNTQLITSENSLDILKTSESTLYDLKDLIVLTKGIANHLYGQLVSIDVLDPNLVSAAAEFIKSTRESIADFIQLYRDERNFLHKVELSILQFNQRKELLKYKQELTNKENSINMAKLGEVKYSQEAVINALDELDKEITTEQKEEIFELDHNFVHLNDK